LVHFTIKGEIFALVEKGFSCGHHDHPVRNVRVGSRNEPAVAGGASLEVVALSVAVVRA
jgi:hypothetical protein